MDQSKNLVQDLMTITGWSQKQVIDSLVDLKNHNLIQSRENGKLILKEVTG